MLRRGLLAGLAACVVALSAAASTAAHADRAQARLSSQLAPALARALAAPDVDPGRTAAFAVDLQTGRVVFQRNPSLALAPASAEKLAVAFAALRRLDPSFRFRTEVRGAGELAGRVWRGDLHLVGYGDPTLDRSDLDDLARDVRAWGIRRVTGAIVGDESRYDSRRTARGWKPSFLGLESAPLSALSVDEVLPRGANGSAAAAASAFEEALARRGVAVLGRPRAGRTPLDVLPLALDFSEPLSEIVLRMNRESDNFVAEMLLKELGAAVGRRGSSAAGAAVVKDVLAEAGVPLSGVRIVDGSGLSLLDRTTARSLVVLLRAADRDPDLRDAFIASLPVAGVSGTLRDRLGRRLTRGKVIAKTGTTSHASALVGFVRRRYAFAIVQNGSPVSYWSARAAQDRFVTVLARP
jgi:D-alanyl-D-alanine carboxypeptidase/D-alanyl-D-alanine-endopeptidase (penicillin-binding protein 4)